MGHFESAQQILEQARGKVLTSDEREKRAVELAGHLLEESIHYQTPADKKTREELARMMDDPKGKAFTMSMTDECFRSHSTSRIANQLVFLLNRFGIPRYLSPIRRLSLY